MVEGGWRLTAVSALAYTLAFNLTFLIQELFLVLPKALTPGLRPTLFHNNHRWEGDNPLASLFQGTGVVAIALSGVVCALLWKRSRHPSAAVRLFLFWMAYSGLFMALPQIAIGAVNAQSDAGMAMNYLGLGATTKNVLALLALSAMPVIALRMGGTLLQLARQAELGTARHRARFLFQAAFLPALIALPLIVLFRIPREWIEVAAVPAVVTLLGVPWILAAALLRVDAVETGSTTPIESITKPLVATVLLLLVFQLLLRPGIRFYG